MCYVCRRESRGFRYDPKAIRIIGPVLHFCSMRCMGDRMIDPTANELKAMEMSSERAGEYLGWLKKTDMAEFSKKEWSDLIEVIVGGYFEGMQNLAEKALEIEPVPY